MKSSKTTAAAAILSFTLVGASSAFALGAGTSTGSPAADSTQAAVEVIEVVSAAPAETAAVVAAPVAAPAETVDVAAAVSVAAPAAVTPEVSHEKSEAEGPDNETSGHEKSGHEGSEPAEFGAPSEASNASNPESGPVSNLDADPQAGIQVDAPSPAAPATAPVAETAAAAAEAATAG